MKHHPMFRFLKICAAALMLASSAGSAYAAAPEIVVEQPAGTNIADGGSVAYGSVVWGANKTLTFTVKNIGDADLTGVGVTVTGADQSDFAVTTSPAATVGAAGSTTFVVTFTPSKDGSHNAQIRVSSNDADENPFNIDVSGTGISPEISVEQPAGTAVASGGSKSFGSVNIGSNSSLVFTIKNTGNANLTGLAITKSGTDASAFTVTANPTAPVTGPSGSTTFTVQFTPTFRGVHNASISIANNDPDGGESPYVIDLSGTGLAPEIAVLGGGGASIASGGSQSFGNVLQGSSNRVTFTIQNTGNANLTGLVTSIDGAAAADYQVTTLPTAPVSASGSTTFAVEFTPSAAGTRTAAIHITNNDPDGSESPYNITLTGVGSAPASGTDAFGYRLSSTPVNAFTLKTTDADVVTATSLSGDDYYQALNLGFTFYFYDKAYTSLTASTNGQLVFGGQSNDWSPDTIPSTNSPNNFVAPFWTDLVKGTASNILYTTRGSAPNRVFIIEYQDMEEYANSAAKVSFQVLLYEGSNNIEVQYKRLDGFSTTRNVSVGIENATGTDGIQYMANLQRPSTSNAILFTRPVVVDLVSKYVQPGGTTQIDVGTTTVGLNPGIGVTKEAYMSVKRFEAPEFIYLNKDFAVLTAAGNVNDAVDNVAWYRLVNDGYAIDGQVVQGTHTFFSTTLTHDVTVVWRWRLECAVIIDSATGQGGFGNPVPEVGRQWYRLGDQFTASIDTSISNTDAGFRFYTAGYTLKTKSPTDTGVSTPFPADTSTRRATTPVSISQPLRLQWNFTGQVRYRFDATSASQGGGFLDGQSFVRVYAADRTTVESTVYGSGANREIWIDSGATAGRKVECGAFYRTQDRRVTLSDFALAPGGDLGGLGQSVSPLVDTTLADQQGVSRVARVYTVSRATNPTDVHWLYQPTVFRAEIELGNRMDGVVPNPVLQPDLPDDAVLKVSDTGSGNMIVTKTPPPDGSIMGVGDPLRWDRVGLGLFPVRPGRYEITWPDELVSSSNYKIEILSGYPNDVAKWPTPVEDSAGARIRQNSVSLTGCVTTSGSVTITTSSVTGLVPGMIVDGANIPTGSTIASVGSTSFNISAAATGSGTVAVSAWKYVYNVTLPDVDPMAGYPAQAEHAHYRHLYDPVPERRAPTKLDLSAKDEWKFQDMTFADGPTGAQVNKSEAGVPFTASGAGRSVLLYSYRSNPDEVADGSLDKENLAVRVVRSNPVTVITRNDPQLVLGRRALQLGEGSGAGAAYGLVQNGGAPVVTNVTFDNRFVVDFWLNSKGFESPAPVTLANCTVQTGSASVTCSSTASLVSGMTVSGTGIPVGSKITSVTNSTTFVISAAATATGSGLSLIASDRPVTLLTTGDSGFKVVLDPGTSTVAVQYRGAQVTHDLSVAGASWRHHAIHVFTYTFFGIEVTVVDYYLDGIRQENGYVTNWFPGTASSTVGPAVTTGSLRIGVDAASGSGLQIDNLRLFNLGTDPDGYLTPAEVRLLRTSRDLTQSPNLLRSVVPQLSFDFEGTPSSGMFANNGSLATVALGLVGGSYDGTKWANVDIQEVATRIESTLDNAGFSGTGYSLNAVSNYNAELYTRNAEVGEWGPIFPVNHNQLFVDANRRLEVAYYENPYITDPIPHPNVAWPYVVTEYKDVTFPVVGPHKDKAIYIASRIGSEGVDRKGYPQKVYDLTRYSNLKVYNQPDKLQAGYNPNEEHALAAASGRAALKVKNLGEDAQNNPPLAAFALQADLNAKSSSYTSDPWVLVQVKNNITGEPEMAAYQVFKTRLNQSAAGALPFPRPSDALVNSTPGLSYESASNPEDRFLVMDPSKSYNFCYAFSYPIAAGDLLVPPYPLNLVIGNTAMLDSRGGNDSAQRTLWRDVYDNSWCVSGNGRFFYQFFYPFRSDFYLPSTPVGTPVAWVPDEINGTRTYTGTGSLLNPGKVVYNSFWRSDYPKLKRGETLTYQGGEYFNETPGAKGLPALVAMKSAEIVYDVATPSMIIRDDNVDSYSARIIRPLDRYETPFTVAQMAAAGFSPASSSIFIVAERWYFKDLPGSLQRRFYFDSLAERLVFRGYLNDKDSGNPDLTSGPDPLNILEPNVITADDLKLMTPLGTGSAWASAVAAIHAKSVNPMMIRKEQSPLNPVVTGKYLAGMREAPVVTNRIGLNQLLYGGGDLSDEEARIKAQADASKILEEQWSLATSNLFGSDSGFVYPKQDVSTSLMAAVQAKIDALGYVVTKLPNAVASQYAHLDSFGVGSALVSSPALLTSPTDGSRFVTIVENNRPELEGAPISLHIIEIIPDRYRGALKVIEAADAFSEKVTIQHNGEFGANTGDLYYEWWIRDAAALDVVAGEVLANGTLKETDSSGNSLWQQYIPKDRLQDNTLTDFQKHLGLNSIVFEGRPDVTLVDKLVLMRYRHKNESNWTLVPFEVANPSAKWKPGSPAPFQWAGAANSPQLQADGSKRYIPQLVMGWVKRVLDRINPYEARYTDFFSNESPATYSSQIQIAGPPYAGKVALNPDKNVIERTGLIELYRTVLDRAKELSIDNSSNGNATDGINQALLLAATRLSVLYELLAREAYTDAQDSTINAGEDSSLAGVASYTHAFQNMEADLQHEELALLRGTDFGKSYPVYNRMFWNYAKGLGEAAYNVNYHVYDANSDGFINEDDARKLYPQGHGDSWGHFVTAIEMPYTLLQHPAFSWKTRSELYSLMQNVLEVDYLDEKTFARLASGKARAGRDIVRNTYRLAYTQDPDGQWQGYSDSADPARAWGVSEWAHRTGQGAWFDWAVANALLPQNAAAATPVTNPENLDRIERLGAVDQIGEIAGGLHEIQTTMDEANNGVNPLGFDSDAMAFDIDPEFSDNDSSHFEQIYDRAVASGNNALATLDLATQAQNKLGAIADDTEGLIQEAMSQDLDYRNRLIEIFGRPYAGTIGFGKAYPEGYLGPDTLLFAYLDKTKIDQIVPPVTGVADTSITYKILFDKAKGSEIMNNQVMVDLYKSTGQDDRTLAFETLLKDSGMYRMGTELKDLSLPYKTTSRYGFQALSSWGQRTSYGRVQVSLQDMLSDEIELDTAISDYIAYLKDMENKIHRIQSELELYDEKEDIKDAITGVRAGFTTATSVAAVVINTLAAVKRTAKAAQSVAKTAIPDDVIVVGGLAVGASIPTSPAEAAVEAATEVPAIISETARDAALSVLEIANLIRDEIIAKLERDVEHLDQIRELEGMVEELQSMTGADRSMRDAIGAASLSLEMHRQDYLTAQAEGFRLLKERESFNKALAAKVQKNRYQDMIFRLSRNEAIGKYQSAFQTAAQYAWLAARAYDFDTSLDQGHPAAPGALLDQIVRERQLGSWVDGQPVVGHGGLAEILAQLKGNFDVLKGQLGINNPQSETEKISLRSELFRISSLDPELAAAAELQQDVTTFNIPLTQLTLDQRKLLALLDDPANQEAVSQAPASNDRWKDAIKARIVPNLNALPEFVRHCRPFATGVQPGVVIRFSTCIEPGKNIFGHQLAAGDHNYSTSNFATKVRGMGVWMDNYNAAGLSTSPRAYLVPIGNDYLRTSTSASPIVRTWKVVDQRIPTPFVINPANLSSPGYIPSMDGMDGVFGELRRHGDFRMYHDNGDPEADDSELVMDSRSIGRSVWNSEWMLVIPGSGLDVNPEAGLRKLADSISDIKLYFLTYSHQGQ